jgi:catechol 2,3-dioxygenase-like lactoylglutathione lyase family enzyme
VDAWHRRLVAAGVEVVETPSRSERYRIYHAFYRDPDGHLVEIQEFADPNWAGPAA